jgi:hypothetical protein
MGQCKSYEDIGCQEARNARSQLVPSSEEDRKYLAKRLMITVLGVGCGGRAFPAEETTCTKALKW